MIDKNDPRLTAYVLGELGSAEAARVEAAIDESDELKLVVDEIQRTTELLTLQFSQETELSLTSTQRAEILADLEPSVGPVESAEHGSSEPGGLASTNRRRRWMGWILVAGMAWILGSLAYWSVEPRQPMSVGTKTDDLSAPKATENLANDSPQRENRKDGKAYKVEPKAKFTLVDEDAASGLSKLGSQSISETEKLTRTQRGEDLGLIVPPSSNGEDANLDTRGLGQTDNPGRQPNGVHRFVSPDDGRGRLRTSSKGTSPNELATDSVIVDRTSGAGADSKQPGIKPGLVLNQESAIRGRVSSTRPLSSSRSKMDRYWDSNWMYYLPVPEPTVMGGLEDERKNLELKRQVYFELDSTDHALAGGALFYKRPQTVLDWLLDSSNIDPGLPFHRIGESDRGVELASGWSLRAYGGRSLMRNGVQTNGAFVPGNRIAGVRYDKPGEPTLFIDQVAQISVDELKRAYEKEQRGLAGASTGRNDFPVTFDAWLSQRIGDAPRWRSSFGRVVKRAEAASPSLGVRLGDHSELKLQGMQVDVHVEGFRARVLMDCFYYNQSDMMADGRFEFRLPDDASPYYFAYGPSVHEYSPKDSLDAQGMVVRELGGRADPLLVAAPRPEDVTRRRVSDWKVVKEAKVIPREEAAPTRLGIHPATAGAFPVPTSRGGLFEAPVSPLMPKNLYRVVLGYDVGLTPTPEGWSYRLDLPDDLPECQVNLSVAELKDAQLTVSPNVSSPSVAERTAGTQFYRFRGAPLVENGLELEIKTPMPIVLRSVDEQDHSLWGTRLVPPLTREASVGNDHAVFLLDTSLSNDPRKFELWRKLLRETLTRNRDSIKQFAVLVFSVDNFFWREGYSENTPTNVESLMADCEQLALAGATDLYSAIGRVADCDWVAKSEPDVFLLGDGVATWGETDFGLIQTRLEESTLGKLFAYQLGTTGPEIDPLQFLAGASGGAVFGVTHEEELSQVALAHRGLPWEIVSIDADGATDVMTDGRLRWIYPGQPLTVVGRGNVNGTLTLKLAHGDTQETVRVALSDPIDSSLASRLYGQVSVDQLERLGLEDQSVIHAYARYFRITGQTHSLGFSRIIERDAIPSSKADLQIVRKNVPTALIDAVITPWDQQADPSARWQRRANQLEAIAGVEFEMSPALRSVVELASWEPRVLFVESQFRTLDQVDANDRGLVEKSPASQSHDYGLLVDEFMGSFRHPKGDALKLLSNSVELHPRSTEVAMGVAFEAMGLEAPEHALGLLERAAQQNPVEPTVYLSIAKCLVHMGQADLALVYYEFAMKAKFPGGRKDHLDVAGTEYAYLLRKIARGELESNAQEYSRQRLKELEEREELGEHDLVVTVAWSAHPSDLDLHVTDPSGNEGSVKQRSAEMDGQFGRDMTGGFGPEMFRVKSASDGEYQLKVHRHRRSKDSSGETCRAFLTIYQNYGRTNESVTHKVVSLVESGKAQLIATVTIDNADDPK